MKISMIEINLSAFYPDFPSARNFKKKKREIEGGARKRKSKLGGGESEKDR